MTRLLKANFARLFKGKIFWLGIAAAVILGALEIIPQFSGMRAAAANPGCVFYFDGFLFNASHIFLMVITAVFTGVFVGAEHGGALRNKLIAGQRRIAVYFSELIVCLVSVCIFHLAYFGSICVTGLLAGAKSAVSIDILLLYEFLQLSSLLGMCALFTAITMLIPKKLAGAIAALLLAVGLFFIENAVFERLLSLGDEKSVYDNAYYENEYDSPLTDAELAERNFLFIVEDILPFGQFRQIGVCYNREAMDIEPKLPAPIETAWCSLGITAVTTAAGILVFRKKDIK